MWMYDNENYFILDATLRGLLNDHQETARYHVPQQHGFTMPTYLDAKTGITGLSRLGC
jgi:hypothetical protein